MIYKGFKTLKIRVDRGVAFVTIDNPPMNVLDMTLLMEHSKEVEKRPERDFF